MFYIPYYAQMFFRCSGHTDGKFGSQTYEDLYHNITAFPYFTKGKPHFMTLGMPEMLGGLSTAPPWVANVLYIVLEVYHQARANNPERWYYNTLVAPYQAYGHFTERNRGVYMDTVVNKHRKIHVFLAAQSRRLGLSASTDFRSMVVKQMPAKTKESFSTYLEREHNALDDVVMFGTSRSCEVTQAERIVEWMQNSVFCLQPPGDTATRKSFYDSIITGCIPVLFELPYIPTHVTYPFDTKIDYSKFTVMIPANKTFIEVLDPYRYDTDAVKQLQKNLARVAKYLQYNDITTADVDVDAFHLLLDQVGEHFGFVDKSLLL